MAQQSNNLLLWTMTAITLVVLGLYIFSDQKTDVPDTLEPVVLGVIAPFSGDSAVYGEAVKRAYDLAAEKINTAGGVNGREIRLVYEDGKCSASNATTAAQKLINIDNVPVILGGVCSDETLAAAELTQVARVLLLSPTSTSPEISQAGDLVFRTYPSDTVEVDLFVRYASEELGFKKAAIISEETEYAQAIHKIFASKFIEAGHNVVFDASFNTETADFENLATSIRSAKPDFVYVIPQSSGTGEMLLRALKQKRVDVEVFGSNAMLDRVRIQAEPDLFDGVILSEVVIDEERAQTASVLTSYEIAYKTQPDFVAFTMSAYDSLSLVALAMENGNTDGEAIAQFLQEMSEPYQGSLGDILFLETGDIDIGLGLVRIERGAFVEL